MPRPLSPKPGGLAAVAHPPPLPHDQLGQNNNSRSPAPPTSTVTEHETPSKKRRYGELAEPEELLRHEATAASRSSIAKHSAATVALARLRGRQEAVDEGRAAINTYIQDLRNDLDGHFGLTEDNSESDGRPRQSMIVDSVKRDYYTRIEDAKAHCQRVLISGSELPVLIKDAVRQEAKAKGDLVAAKARLIILDHIWEAKKKRQEEARAQDEYLQLKRRVRDIQVQFDKAREVLAEKHQAATASTVRAEQEDWAGILEGLGMGREQES